MSFLRVEAGRVVHKDKFPFRSAQTRPVGRAHAPTHLEEIETWPSSPSPKSSVDALESNAATATLLSSS